MPDIEVYRGGNSLIAKATDVVTDPASGLIQPVNGVSVSSRPDKLVRFGGPYRVTNVPPELEIIRVGKKRHHYEIVPTRPMSMGEYQGFLDRIVLVPIPTPP